MTDATTTSPAVESSVDPASQSHPIIAACQAGDIEELKRLFSSSSATEVDRASASQQYPDVDAMFAAAAKHKQVQSIKYLSSVFPSTRLSYGATSAGFATADARTLRALLEHDRSIADYEENYSTKLCDFCRGSNPDLASLLLEYGADPELRPTPICVPLAAAVEAQPMELIRKLIACGAKVTQFSIRAAELSNRAEVADYLRSI